MANTTDKDKQMNTDESNEEQAVKIPIESEQAPEETPKESSPERESKDQADSDKDAESAPDSDLESKIKQLEAESKENYDRFLRATAELENFKKRSAREMENFKKFANESIIKDLLPIIDNLERAVVSSVEHEPNSSQITEGVELTLKEIFKMLDKHGVSPIEALNCPFDPNYHEAIMREPSADHPENTVIKEFQKGYMLHDRLIRPSMVVVSTAPTDASPTNDTSDNQEPQNNKEK